MLTLYSYPGLFGVADNNPFGLKVYAFLRLAGLPFRHEHIFDASQAPRGQLPYIVEDGETVGDSDGIIAHLTARHGIALDAGLTAAQRATAHMARRTLEDLYWVMSWSRWADPRFWPLFRDAVLREHPAVTAAAMESARAYNAQRYHYQGIGRYAPEQVLARGIADLEAVGALLPEAGFAFGPRPGSLDAAIYGFLANSLFFEIDTPLRACIAGHPRLAAHCRAMHALVGD